MKGLRRITAMWLIALALCMCTACNAPAQNAETTQSAQPAQSAEPAQEAAARSLTAYSSLDAITPHGNVCLVTDHIIQLEDLKESGIEPGDTVRVTFLDQALEMPVGFSFSEAASGSVMLRTKDDAVELAINMGDFASTYFADKSNADDGSVTWHYKEGVDGPVTFRVELIQKGDNNQDAVQLIYSDERDDYKDLSDAAFANCRMVTTTGMGNGALYRTSSPIDPTHNRNAYVDNELKTAGVKTVINLADSQATAESYEGYTESYYASVNHVELSMSISFDTESFREMLADGLRFLGEHEGPYAVHCQEGKDRTGVVVALLECFMGATCDEVIQDYMATFYNYYGIAPSDEDYASIANNNIVMTLQKLLDITDLANADLAQATADYFRTIGMSDAEINSLRANLAKSYLAESSDQAKAAA